MTILTRRHLLKPCRMPLRLEQLERRETPAALIVNSASDDTLADTLLTLREAVALANFNGNAPAALGRALTIDEQAQISGTFGADTITFGGVTFTGSATINLSLGAFVLFDPSATTIQGPGAARLTVAGAGGDRVFDVTGDAAISGMSITGGNAGFDNGGGVRNGVGSLTLTGVRMMGNAAGSGGGLYNLSGAVTLIDVDMAGNLAASAGGGIATAGGVVTGNRVNLSGNSAGNDGGGLWVGAGTVTLTNITVANNVAAVGAGGLELGVGTDVTLQSATVVGNSGLFAGGVKTAGTFSALHSLVMGNDAVLGSPDINGTALALTGSLVGVPMGLTLGDVIAVDGLGRPVVADNGGSTRTVALVAGSPAINAGSTTITTDQRGAGRIGAPDIGAFEFVPTNRVVDVTTDIDNGNYAPGDLSLREAIFLANANPGPDIITFNLGGAATITLGGNQLTLADTSGATTISGPGASLLTISGDNKSRIFEIASGITAVIDGMTLTQGSAVRGGAVYNFGTLTVTDAKFVGNFAVEQGAGIHSGGPDSDLTVTSSTFSGNSAGQRGGGIYARLSKLAVTSSTLTGNSAGQRGGGIDSFILSTLTVTDSSVSGNSAGQTGGGIYSRGNSVVSIINSTLSGNSAVQSGGGLRTYNLSSTDTLSIISSTVSGNSAGAGGGINTYHQYLGSCTIISSTISGNSAGTGGGILVAGSNGLFGLTNSIVAGNGAATNADVLGPVAGSNSLLNLSAAAAGLGTLGNYGGPTQTIPLLPGSPAIDAGGSTTLTLDQRGQSRVGAPDIGAFESQGFTLTPTGGGQSATVSTSFANPLGVTVTATNPVEPVNGGVVTFTPPVSDALAVLSASTVTITAGSASVTATANDMPGSYNVVVSASGAGSASLALTNLAKTETPSLVVTTASDVVDNTDFLTSLREAIAFANSNPGADTITFSSLFNSPQTITLGGTQLTLTDKSGATTISGPGASLLTISGDNASRVFQVTGKVTASISDVTVTDGIAAQGGGISNNGTLTLTNTTISGNLGTSGGGISNNGTLTVTNSAISGNNASLGGGIYNNGSLMVTNSTISGNTVNSDGGGILNLDTLTLVNSTLSGNSTNDGGGGGIMNFGLLTVTDSALTGNMTKSLAFAGHGGGIHNNGTLILTNSTLSGNSAIGSGGGIYNFVTSTLTATNSTLSGNSASTGGGGIANSGTLNATNSIIAGNSNGDLANKGINGTNLNNLVNMSAAAAGLGALGNYGGPTQTIPLLPGSPAINAGGSTTLTLDQRGKSYVGAPDIGAFESQGFNITAKSGSGQATLVNTAFASPLVATVSANNPVEPVNGGVLSFVVPGSGASAVIPNPVTIVGGEASVVTTANGVRGSYSVTVGGASFSLTNEVQPTFTLTPQTVTYGDIVIVTGSLLGNGEGAIGFVTVTLAGNGITPLQLSAVLDGVGGFSATFNDTLAANVTPYSVTVNYTGQDGFRSANGGPVNLSVNRRAASVTPNSATKVVGQVDPPLTGTLSGFLPQDNVTAIYTRAPGETVGNYPITATLSPSGVLSNYSITANVGTFSITPSTSLPGPINLMTLQTSGGNLSATFNSAANNIEVIGQKGQVTLRSNNTTIATFNIVGNITINAGSSSDTITVTVNSGQSLPGTITINAGAGNDVVRIRSSGGTPGTLNNLTVVLGEGANSVVDNGVIIANNFTITAGTGNDTVGPLSSPIANTLNMNLGNGNNVATVTSPIGNQLRYTGGAGADNLTLGGMQSYYLYALMGAGNDTLTFQPGSSIGSGLIDFGLGIDSYVPNGVFVGGGLTVLGL